MKTWVDDYLNEVGEIEARCVSLCEAQHSVGPLNDRWVAIAKTHFEQGCLALDRAARHAPTAEEDESVQGDLFSEQVEDISGEEWREYTFDDGYVIRIKSPKTLYIEASGAHRVFDGHTTMHVPADWRTIVWGAGDGHFRCGL